MDSTAFPSSGKRGSFGIDQAGPSELVLRRLIQTHSAWLASFYFRERDVASGEEVAGFVIKRIQINCDSLRFALDVDGDIVDDDPY